MASITIKQCSGDQADIDYIMEMIDRKFEIINGEIYFKFGKRKGQRAETKHSKGYLLISTKGISMYAHRAVFLMHNGFIPPQIDHINTIKTDNRIENLRPVTGHQNQCNHNKRKDNTSGYKGVCWHNQSNKWRAYVSVNNKQKSLGLYDSKEDAADAARNGRIKYHGDYANFG